jgi:hypothetical protein
MFALGRQDPYAVVFAWMGTLASIGILALQFMVSLAVIFFFFRSNARGIGVWPRLLAPALSATGLGGCLALMVANLSLVSGSRSSEPAGKHARSRVVPSAAALPPPVRDERM